jgi:hypothetical protein
MSSESEMYSILPPHPRNRETVSQKRSAIWQSTSENKGNTIKLPRTLLKNTSQNSTSHKKSLKTFDLYQ